MTEEELRENCGYVFLKYVSPGVYKRNPFGDVIVIDRFAYCVWNRGACIQVDLSEVPTGYSGDLFNPGRSWSKSLPGKWTIETVKRTYGGGSMKIKVGEKVRIKTAEEMGLSDGSIPLGWTEDMRYLFGEIVTVVHVCSDGRLLYIQGLRNDGSWAINIKECEGTTDKAPTPVVGMRFTWCDIVNEVYEISEINPDGSLVVRNKLGQLVNKAWELDEFEDDYNRGLVEIVTTPVVKQAEIINGGFWK